MSTPFEIPEWLVAQSAPPPPPPVDDHRVESLVNNFIASKQDALFDAPDAYYRNHGRDTQRLVFQRDTFGTRRALIRRAAIDHQDHWAARFQRIHIHG